VGGKAFTDKEVRGIKRLDPSIQTAIPVIVKRLRVKTPYKQQVVDITASDGEYQSVRSITMAEGIFYSQTDVDRSRKVAVLGPTAAKNLFPNVSLIGQMLTISSVPFKIVGLTNPRGGEGAFGSDVDNQLYIPLSSMQKLIDSNGIDTISVKAQDQQSVTKAINVIKLYLEKQRQPDSFSVVDQRQLLGTAQSILGIMTLGLSGIAAISLVVGGIGVMNMMLVTVTERTQEIGLRKALGATPRVILAQFLVESVLLSLSGGIIGVLIGGVGSLAVNRFFPTRISGWAIGLAFGVSTLVGVVFGILPARRAAKLSPIEALRYE
jgi:putative ABC transport system permease protein